MIDGLYWIYIQVVKSIRTNLSYILFVENEKRWIT